MVPPSQVFCSTPQWFCRLELCSSWAKRGKGRILRTLNWNFFFRSLLQTKNNNSSHHQELTRFLEAKKNKQEALGKTYGTEFWRWSYVRAFYLHETGRKGKNLLRRRVMEIWLHFENYHRSIWCNSKTKPRKHELGFDCSRWFRFFCAKFSKAAELSNLLCGKISAFVPRFLKKDTELIKTGQT